MTVSSDTARLSVVVPVEYRKRLVSRRARRGELSGALLQCIQDATSLYGLPSAMREVLEKDMKRRRISDQREYVQALLVERFNAVTTSAKREQSEAHR